jgi:threonyl-tRNA synthetase
MIELELPNGDFVEVERGTVAGELVASLPQAENVVAVLIDGELVDLHSPVFKSGKLSFVRAGEPESLPILRHSTAHVLAKAVKRLFGVSEVKLGIGPSTEDGFYYDFDLPHPLTAEDLSAVEEEMRKIVDGAEPFVREEVTRERAKELFKDDPYKTELLSLIPEGEPITIYWLGDDFYDLCRGPHLRHAGMIKAFKLLSVAGAYWRGDSRNKMLQRVYGTAFWSEKELRSYLRNIEEAKRRDHRLLGRELELFEVFEEAGPGLVFWLPKGAVVRRELERWIEEEHEKRGYLRIYTPHMMRVELWKTSGHYSFYRENMFFVPVPEHGEPAGTEEVPVPPEELKNCHWYAVKPMNCPGHILIYRSRVRSYRDLPLRFFELGTVYRYEKSGALHGLLRVRGFTQDDGHIFCTPDQLKQEIESVLDYVMELLSTFKLDYRVNIGTKPEKSIGSEEAWEHATQALMDALSDRGVEYSVVEGDGAFYGPKIDIVILDALGRKWDGPTIQVDFNLPERFNLTYVDRDGEKRRPVMVHRAILGSIERFMGLLIEHYAGFFPTWLSPVQAVVIPVSDRHLDYAKRVWKHLAESGIRAELDDEDAKVGYKIRKAEKMKVPYMLVVGAKEEESETVSVRSKREKKVESMKLETFLNKILTEIRQKL